MEESVTGSCLCGGVRYEVRLPFALFGHCHCSRCRKKTGTGHATAAIVAPAAFSWAKGEELVVRYDLPTARSFATAFCRVCGSPLPHATRSGREVIVPAGSMDEDPGVTTDHHGYWGSRAVWLDCGSHLPRFDEGRD